MELIVAGFEQLSPLYSAYGLAQIIKPHLTPDTPVFMVRTYSQGLPPYLRRPVTLVDYQDEFQFGLQQEPMRAIATVEEFAVIWRNAPHAVAVMPASTFQQLEASSLPMRVIENRGDLRVVIRN